MEKSKGQTQKKSWGSQAKSWREREASFQISPAQLCKTDEL